MKTRDTAAWFRVLRASGVRETTANRWAPVFAATIKADTFSKGEADLADFLPTILHESAALEKMKESGYYSVERIRQVGNANPPGSRWLYSLPLPPPPKLLLPPKLPPSRLPGPAP